MRRAIPMLFRCIVLPLCLCIFGTTLSLAVAKTLDASAAKQKVEQRGIGKRARITETNGSMVDGTVLSIDPDSFQMQPKTGAPVALSYSQVTAVHGPGLSKGAKWAIGIGIGLGATVGIGAAVFEYEFHKPIGPISLSGIN